MMSQPQEMCEKLSPDENIFINEADGLTNQHPILPYDIDDDEDDNDMNHRDKKKDGSRDSFDDLPTSLIVTNIHSSVFQDEQAREEMENLFKFFSPNVKFQWFRSFKRMRVNYEDAVAAATARIQLHQYQIGKSTISCYFAQPVTPVAHKFLQLPKPYKNFLISPPASPPAGKRKHKLHTFPTILLN